MKIYKISVNNFAITPGNPNSNAPQDPAVILQNMQTSQQAMDFLSQVMQAVSQLQAKVTELDTILGVSTGLQQAIEEGAKKAIAQTPAFSVISKLWGVTDVSMLEDSNTITRIQQQTIQNIQNSENNAAVPNQTS